MFGQDQLEPVHLVAELADLAFLSGDEGADCRRVVRWQVTVGEQFRGVPVVLPDDALVAVHGDGQAAEEGALCFVKFLWAVSAFLLVRLSGCF